MPFCVCTKLLCCSWLDMGAEPGDRVEVDEPIAQIETDKVIRKMTFILFL